MKVEVLVKVKRMRSVDEVEAIFGNLRNVFVRPDAARVDVIEVVNEYLRNFQHIKKERSLDLIM